MTDCYNFANQNRVWKTDITLASVELQNGRMDIDAASIYMAFDTTPLEGIFIITINQADGSPVGSVRKRSSSQQLKIGSLYAGDSSVVYVSSYSFSAAYTELIQYDSSSNEYTIYEQTGLDFRFQYINSAQSNYWIGLLNTEFAHLSKPSTMDQVANLSISVLSNTGLTTETTSNTTSTSSGLSFFSITFSPVTSTIGADFDVDVVVLSANAIVDSNTSDSNTVDSNAGNSNTGNSNTGETNAGETNTGESNTNSDGSISTLALVLIIIGAAILIVIVLTIVLCIIRCCKKSRNVRGEMSIVETPADESNALKEENKI